MTAFAHPSLLDNRYAVIAETSIYTYDDDDLINYAEFLRNHGRYMTKEGYVDSSRRIRALHRQQDDLEVSKHQASPIRGGLLASINKSSSSAPATTPRKLKESNKNKSTFSASASINLENKRREYHKQMKVIEEQMIKAKQSEREAKRLEGDIKKEKRELQHSLRELDVDATRKRYNAEKHLSKNLQEKDKIEREFIKKREKYTRPRSPKTLRQITNLIGSSRACQPLINKYLIRQTKQRTDRAIDSLQGNKDKDRRNLLLCNDLARQYRTKANELEIKHQQLGRIHSDFEQKVQQKELEENRLKKELNEIAVALNLEAQKAKTDMNDFLNMMDHDRTQTNKYDLEQEQRLNQGNAYVKNYDLERHRSSSDVTLHRSMLDLKQREALRRIGDTKNRLETIYTKQRQLNASTAITEQDRRAAQLMNQHIRDKTQEHEAEGANKAKTHHTELETKKHEDRLRHLEKVVSKSEEIEKELRRSVKDIEFQRRKKEQEIQRLKSDLTRKKKEDAKKVRDAIARSEQEEKELERHLTKEKVKLNKLQTRREDNYVRLTQQREQMRENKALLDTHVREHERLLHVQDQSQSLQSFNTI